MNTIPLHLEGTGSVPALPLSDHPAWEHPHGHGDPGGFRIRVFQAGPLFLKAAVTDPLRLLLRPLAHWLMEPHLALPGEEPGDQKIPVNLKPTSLLAMVLTALLGPLVFLMLLPLLLVLVPVFLGMAMLGALASSQELDPLRDPIQAATA